MLSLIIKGEATGGTNSSGLWILVAIEVQEKLSGV
jgi:hypothetical protein